jgi:hypothetical protein
LVGMARCAVPAAERSVRRWNRTAPDHAIPPIAHTKFKNRSNSASVL